MNDATLLTVATVLGALVLVGRAAWVRRRQGEPIGRYAMIWAAIFAAAFAIAIAVGRR